MATSREKIVFRSDLAMMLADLRLERGWTKKELAQRLGISASSLSKLESGLQYSLWQRTWDRVVEPLAALLEVSPEELKPAGKELVALVEQPALEGFSEQTALLDLLARDPNLDEEGRHFVAEAYWRARRSSTPALAPAR
jgi:transcriptional regulator with XRE-family HTH domain